MKKIKSALVFIFIFFFASTSFCCTIVSCSRNGKAFAAANEDDYISTLYARIWFNPPTKDRYGTVCFGLSDLQAQAIMNEYGLFVDCTAQNTIDPAKVNLKNPYLGDLLFEILGKCKNVKEAIEFLKTHEYALYSCQALLADAEGNSVVINAGVQVMKEGNYQINTNFNISDLKRGITDRRYDIANEMLQSGTDVSVPYLKTILDRTHQEGNLTTLYSYVFDMKKGLIYVYFFHNFDNAYVIDIKKELKKGYRLENLADSFTLSYAYESFIKKDPGYKKEVILSEIYKKGLDVTVAHYLSLLNTPIQKDSTLKTQKDSLLKMRKDSALRMTMLEVGLQLVKDAYNRHAQGAMWLYWFSLPDGYTVSTFKDERLDAAKNIFECLKKQEPFDAKLKNFVTEIDAYVSLVQGKNEEAKTLYKSASANRDDTYPVSYDRAKEMLTRIN
ncbi:carcinine hydrolase/isopenicillin-N N-acyltransferase family protein [Chitinophagaceae bacterium LWZ2-11]